jgi:hypothetical protein
MTTLTNDLAVADQAALSPERELEPIIEPEETGSEERIVKPWDPKHIRITTKNFTLREIYTQIEDDDLDLAPDFQRSFVWKDSQQIRLIESILLGIPLPAFYFNQDALGAHQVIDGVQRLTTVKLFMSDKLVLDAKHLEYLKVLQGHTYSSIDHATRRRFAGTQIVAHIIEPQTPDEVKYEIFNRVNTGGSPLTAQEIRHCMSKTGSRNFLRRLVERDSFDRATDFAFWSRDASGQAVRDNRRMSDREMALRFCAFRHFSSAEYSQATSLDAFLLDYTRRIDKAVDTANESPDLAELEQAFERAMVNCATVLGNGAFRRWPPTASRRGPINRAIFESQALALANWDVEVLLPRQESIASALRSLFENPDYDDAVRAGTGDVRKVERRLEMPRNVLDELLR